MTMQLKMRMIFPQVKADVQNVSGELIVSGLDSATSLIQAAKNLMNAVVLTVKSCYVASTKYPRLAAEGKLNQLKPVVVWKMKVSLFFRILDGINGVLLCIVDTIQDTSILLFFCDMNTKVTKVKTRKYIRV